MVLTAKRLFTGHFWFDFKHDKALKDRAPSGARIQSAVARVIKSCRYLLEAVVNYTPASRFIFDYALSYAHCCYRC